MCEQSDITASDLPFAINQLGLSADQSSSGKIISLWTRLCARGICSNRVFPKLLLPSPRNRPGREVVSVLQDFVMHTGPKGPSNIHNHYESNGCMMCTFFLSVTNPPRMTLYTIRSRSIWSINNWKVLKSCIIKWKEASNVLAFSQRMTLLLHW